MACVLLFVMALLPCVGSVRADDLGVPGENETLDDDDDRVPRLCQVARPDATNFWRFSIGYEESKGLGHNTKFTLRPYDNCSGTDLGDVSVIPLIDPVEPLTKSRALITLKPREYQGRLVFVCRTGSEHGPCLASVRPKTCGFRPNKLLVWVPGMAQSDRVNRYVLMVGGTHTVVDFLEWVMLVIILCFFATTLRALYILGFAMKLAFVMKFGEISRPTWGVSFGGEALAHEADAADEAAKGGAAEFMIEDVTDAEVVEAEVAKAEVVEEEAMEPNAVEPPHTCPVDISSPFWESLDALVNSTSFVVASTSLLGVVLTVLVGANGHLFLFVIAICWPCLCGNYLLYCFWMTTCRLQIYSAALSRGICVRGQSAMRTSTVLMAFCISMLVFCVLAAAYTLWEAKKNTNYDKVKRVTPFVVNPMSTLLSICAYIYCRIVAHSRTQCPMAIDEMVELMRKSEAEVEAGEQEAKRSKEPQAVKPDGHSAEGSHLAQLVRMGAVPIVSEGTFCQLCRNGADPVEAILAAVVSKEPLDGGHNFSFPDLAWHGKMVHTLSGYRVAILNIPVALFFFLVFAGASVFFAISCLTARPALSAIHTSSSSLTHLVPGFHPWQWDYEFLVDSTSHSATFVSVFSEDSAEKVVIILPAGNISSDDDWVMATVQLDGLTFPMHVGIVVEGIQRQKTQYSLAVVKEYLLILAVRVVGKDFDRFIHWGEVIGGVVSIPSTTDLHVEIFYQSYRMGIPINETHALALATGKASSPPHAADNKLITVFVPMDHKYDKCRIRCANTNYCLAWEIGIGGCFFVYGFGDASLFKRKENFSHGEPRGAALGVNLCTQSQKVMGGLDCNEMDRVSHSILSINLPKMKYTKEVRDFEFHPYKIFGGRKVSMEPRKISFSTAFPKPVAVLSKVDRIYNGESTRSSILTAVELSDHLVQVILQKYYPTSKWLDQLRLYLVFLMPDVRCTMTIPVYVDAVFPSVGQSIPDFAAQCKEAATRYTFIEQYTVCGGWRPAWPVFLDIDPWKPRQDLVLNIVVMGVAKSIRVQIRTAGDVHPAEWVVSKFCDLDLQSLSPDKAFMTVSEPVIHAMTRSCFTAKIKFRSSIWQPDIVEWTQEFLYRNFDETTAIRLLAEADHNPGIRNFTAFCSDVGFVRDGDFLFLKIQFKGERKMLQLKLRRVIANPSSRGRFIDAVCRMVKESELQTSVLTTAVERMDVHIMKSVVPCIRARKGSLAPPRRGLMLHPAIAAIKLRRQDLLREVLRVSTSCISWTDGARDGIQERFTLMELSVTYSCSTCINALRQAGLDSTRLVFTPSTSPFGWKTGAGQTMKQMFVQRMTFSNTFTTMSRILSTMLPIAKAGDLDNLRYLSFSHTSRMTNEAELFEAIRLCELVALLPSLQVLLLGFEMWNLQKAREFSDCLDSSAVLGMRELDLDGHLLEELGKWSEGRTRFYVDYLHHFANLRLVHYSSIAAKGIQSSKASLSMLKQHFPNVSFVDDLDVIAVEYFRRRPCIPAYGMQTYVVGTAPKIIDFDSDAEEEAEPKVSTDQQKIAETPNFAYGRHLLGWEPRLADTEELPPKQHKALQEDAKHLEEEEEPLQPVAKSSPEVYYENEEQAIPEGSRRNPDVTPWEPNWDDIWDGRLDG